MGDGERRYYVAHARGCDFERLAKLGFRHFYPTLDDYVFLEVKPEHEKYLRQQTDLNISFCKDGDERMTVSEAELNAMGAETTDLIIKGSEIKVLIGVAENLEGVVIEMAGDRIRCTLHGYNRNYDVWLNRSEVVLKDKAPHIPVTIDDTDLVH